MRQFHFKESVLEARHGNFLTLLEVEGRIGNASPQAFEVSSLQREGCTLVLCVSSSLIFLFLVLKPCKVFPWGILGKRCFCQRIKHSDACGISHGDKWNRTNGCDSLWRGLSTTSDPATKLWAI